MNNRMLKIDLLTGETHEYVYVLDAINRGQGVCEILAINDHEFLVVERDNRSNLQTPPQAPTRKTIYKIDLTGATDVSGIEGISATALPNTIVPVSKQLFIDLLDPPFELHRNDVNAIPDVRNSAKSLRRFGEGGRDLGPDGAAVARRVEFSGERAREAVHAIDEVDAAQPTESARLTGPRRAAIGGIQNVATRCDDPPVRGIGERDVLVLPRGGARVDERPVQRARAVLGV